LAMQHEDAFETEGFVGLSIGIPFHIRDIRARIVT